MKKVTFISLILLSISSYTLLMTEKSFAHSLKEIASNLPGKVGIWTAEQRYTMYDRETIFDYIDGAAEVYLAYNMQGCLSRRYSAEGEASIVLDIFDMGSSEDAFGVFTHDRDGKSVELGQGALYRPGWMSLWKGRFFVSIYVDRESAAAEKAVLELAKAVASQVQDQGPKPAILSMLPKVGLQTGSIRYLHHPMLLNYHYFLSNENILNLGPDTDVVLATFERSGKRARLLLVLYPNREKAKQAHKKFLTHYLPEAKSVEPVLLEDGMWSASKMKETLLTVVLEAETREFAKDLLSEVENLM